MAGDAGPDQGPDAGPDAGSGASPNAALLPAPPPVPVPPNPTDPAGGGAGRTTYYGLKTGYATDTTLDAVDVDQIVNLLDNLGAGVLAALGAGTITGGDSAGSAGLTLTVHPWRGILPQTEERDGYAPGTTPQTTLTLDPSSAFVVWAVPVSDTYPDAASTPFDTAESGAAELLTVYDGSIPDGGIALLTGTSTTSALTNLTDVRQFVGVAALQTALAALVLREAAVEGILGARYFGSAPPADVDDRLAALETATGAAPPTPGGGTTPTGGTGTTASTLYWSLLQRSSTDATGLLAYIAAQIPPTPAPPTPPPLVTDTEAVNILKGMGTEADLGLKLVTAGLMTLDELKASLATRVDVFFYDPRLYGLDPTLIDTAHTTVPINLEDGSIG